MDRNLIDYLPPVARTMRETKAITDVQQECISNLWDCVNFALNDQFIDSATENGIKRWEKFLSIIPKGMETQDNRRFKIKTRLNEQLPFTVTTLNNQLEFLCGVGGYSLDLQNSSYILHIKISLPMKSSIEDINDMLQRTIPANLVVDYKLSYQSHAALLIATQHTMAHTMTIHPYSLGNYSTCSCIKSAIHTKTAYSFIITGRKEP